VKANVLATSMAHNTHSNCAGTPTAFLLPEELPVFLEYVPCGSTVLLQGAQTDHHEEHRLKDCGLSKNQIEDFWNFSLEPPPKRRKVSWADPIAQFYASKHPEPSDNHDSAGAGEAKLPDSIIDGASKSALKRPQAVDLSAMPLHGYTGRHTIVVRGPSFGDVLSRLPLQTFRRPLLDDTRYTGQKHRQQ